ncbi:MAG: flagellar biosynthetic protein FliO [Armatimonadota bacterium]|nr:flagellar biosynthetic protein FliO [bacterium]
MQRQLNVRGVEILRLRFRLMAYLRIHALRPAGIVLAVMLAFSIAGRSVASDTSKSHAAKATAQAVTSSSDAEDQDFLASLEASENEPAAEKEAPVYITALSFIFKLALVLALAYGTVMVLKKFTNFKATVGATHGRIKVIEHSQLGANRSLHLVAVGSKRLLVASTANQVSLVAELDPEDVADIETNIPTGGQPTGGFKEQLSVFLGNKPDTSESAKTVAQMLRESSSFLQDKVREVGSFRRTYRDA